MLIQSFFGFLARKMADPLKPLAKYKQAARTEGNAFEDFSTEVLAGHGPFGSWVSAELVGNGLKSDLA